MRILHINHRNSGGGAALQGQALHQGLLGRGIDSQILVRKKQGTQDAIHEINHGIRKFGWALAKKCSRALELTQYAPDSAYYSLSLFSGHLLETIRKIQPDLIHLHWLGGETMRIEDIAQIQVPLVWTLHDMWPFCGAEHLDFTAKNPRWETGYNTLNKPAGQLGIDWNRRVWERKLRAWAGRKIIPVAPSTWMKTCIDQSALTRANAFTPAELIHHGISLSEFSPEDKKHSRQQLGIPQDRPAFIFGAHSLKYKNKGGGSLAAALSRLARQMKFSLIVFGQGAVKPIPNIPLFQLGEIHTSQQLRIAYSAADLTLNPSAMESFGLVAAESLACGTPVVCFDTTGLKDVVTHQIDGYRAMPFQVEDYCRGIEWCLSDPQRLLELSRNARTNAVARFSQTTMMDRYIQLYQAALAQKNDVRNQCQATTHFQ
ncbi:MAG: glycosyltransferase involved in cell wall biosynthesis [Lentimonas sp.]|jgi:glycosyltransferase involved in cell wall biosynthesis